MKKTFAIAVVAFGFAGFTGITHAQSAQSTAIQITPTTLPDGVVGVLYSENLNASSSISGRFAFTISPGSLPPGLSLGNSSSGVGAVIFGTPDIVGQYTFGITATNATNSVIQAYGVTIDNEATVPSSTLMVTTTSTASTTLSSTIALQNELNLLLAQLTQLQAEVGASSPAAATTSAVPSGLVFGRDLTIGSTGPDVLALQQFLNSNGFQVAPSGPGSPGNETDYFGPLTQSALAQWQTSESISPAQGYYGPITRARIGAQLEASSTANL